MYCSNCGKELSNEEKYCTACGHIRLGKGHPNLSVYRKKLGFELKKPRFGIVGHGWILLKNKKLLGAVLVGALLVIGFLVSSKMFSILSTAKKFESYAGGYYVGSYENAYGSGVLYAQPFTITGDHTATSIKVAVWRNGYPSGGPGGYDFILRLYVADQNHKPTGPVLASGIFASTDTPTNASADGTPYEFLLDKEVFLEDNSEYVFVISAPRATAPENYGSIHTFNVGVLPAPNGWTSADGGGTWTRSIPESALFEVWGKCSLLNYKCIFRKQS